MATNPHVFWNNPKAFMGFVGFVKMLAGQVQEGGGASIINHDDFTIRANSASINLTQAIEKPEVVDSRYDKSVYQLGPQLIDGSVSFPVLYEIPSGADMTLFELLYRYAVTRRSSDGGLSDFNLSVKYDSSGNADFTYSGCIINTWKFSVAQSDVITCDIDIIGVKRDPVPAAAPPRKLQPTCTPGEADSTDPASIGTTRIVTWNDARVELSGGRIASPIGGQYVRTFDCSINNNAERFYSLNSYLFAQAIAARKRDIAGSLVLIGRHPDLSRVAVENQLNCTEISELKFGYKTSSRGQGCSDSTFNVTLPNVVYEIETMNLTNDIFESTVNYHSLPAAAIGQCDPLLSTLGSTSFTYVPS